MGPILAQLKRIAHILENSTIATKNTGKTCLTCSYQNPEEEVTCVVCHTPMTGEGSKMAEVVAAIKKLRRAHPKEWEIAEYELEIEGHRRTLR